MHNHRLYRFFLLLLILFISDASYAGWQKVFQFPTPARAIYFLDQLGHPEIGFAGLNDGSLWRTIDDGATWQKEFTDPNRLSITDITFKDNLTGWFCTAPYLAQNGPSTVYRTFDGGLTWQNVNTDPGGLFTAIYYFGAQKTLYLSDWNRGAFTSNDDGNSWNEFTTERPLNGYAFTDAQNGILTFAGGSQFDQFSTKDGGTNWQLIFTGYNAWQPAAKPGTTTFFIFSEYTSTLVRMDGIGLPLQTISTIGAGKQFDFTGCLRISGCTSQLYVQSATNQGIFASSDDGATWQSIGGPSNEADSRFWVDGNLVFVSDQSGALWAYDNIGNPVLSLSSDTLSISSGNCNTIDTTLHFTFDICGNGFDSIISAKFTGATAFNLPASEKIPRKFIGRDSLRIIYSPTGSRDTVMFELAIKAEGKEIDTVIRLFGVSPLPFASFSPQLTTIQGTHQTFVVAGKDTTLNFSVSQDIPASEGLDSISFDLKFDPNMLNLDKAQAIPGQDITLDSIQPGSYHCTFRNLLHTDITANQILSSLFFFSFLGVDTISEVHLLPGKVFFDSLHTGCLTQSIVSGDSVTVQIADTCGDLILRNFLRTGVLNFSITSIRPNPAQDMITIETESAMPFEASVIIFDDLGRQWMHEHKNFSGRNNYTFGISSLPTGNYHLMIKSQSGSISSEFVKVH